MNFRSPPGQFHHEPPLICGTGCKSQAISTSVSTYLAENKQVLQDILSISSVADIRSAISASAMIVPSILILSTQKARQKQTQWLATSTTMSSAKSDPHTDASNKSQTLMVTVTFCCKWNAHHSHETPENCNSLVRTYFTWCKLSTKSSQLTTTICPGWWTFLLDSEELTSNTFFTSTTTKTFGYWISSRMALNSNDNWACNFSRLLWASTQICHLSNKVDANWKDLQQQVAILFICTQNIRLWQILKQVFLFFLIWRILNRKISH